MHKIRVLVAPNSFKECADAIEIAGALEKNLTGPEFQIKSIPISDGGDGFLKICENKYQLKTIIEKIPSFYDENFFEVPIGISHDRKQIYLESAEVIGMKKIPIEKRNPSKLNSNNLGFFLIQLGKKYPEALKIVLGLGGTATSDLGFGLCVPFGLKIFNKKGSELPVQPKYFVEVDSITLPERKLSIVIDVVTDVKVPLHGSKGTSKTFAKQKGANANEIEVLEIGVINIISILKNKHGIDFSKRLFGAGGGLLLGLSLITDPHVCFAEEFLLSELQLEKEVMNADFIITGEGAFDRQSLMNKGTGILVRLAQKHKKCLFLICGRLSPPDYFKNSEMIKSFPLEKYFGSKHNSVTNYRIGIEKACCEIKAYILSHS